MVLLRNLISSPGREGAGMVGKTWEPVFITCTVEKLLYMLCIALATLEVAKH